MLIRKALIPLSVNGTGKFTSPGFPRGVKRVISSGVLGTTIAMSTYFLES
jgi:hypothetical protein